LLLKAAVERPLHKALTIHRGPNKGKLLAKVSEAKRARLVRLGRERALLYKTLLLTGLRRNELKSLTIGQLDLDAEMPTVELLACDEKNRKGAFIPLRGDLVDDLRDVLKMRLEVVQEEASERGEEVIELDTDTPLFHVPSSLLRVLDRDLAYADIPKKNALGRTVDLHAFRHTFATHLSKGGVAPRTAQAAMRHSTLDMTMNVYTDPTQLGVYEGLGQLPDMRLDQTAEPPREVVSDDGEHRSDANEFAPEFAPTLAHPGLSATAGVKKGEERGECRKHA